MVTTLLVDGSEVYRRSVHELLSSRYEFMRVAEAATAAEALRQARALRPDLVFMELRLPDASGLQLASELPRTLPWATCCVVSSVDLAEYRAAARWCGVRHYINKAAASGALFDAVVESLLAERFTVLVVDADPMHGETTRRRLSARWPACMPFHASTPAAAAVLAASVKPALVLFRAGQLDAAADGHALAAFNSRGCLVEWPDGDREAFESMLDDLVTEHCSRTRGSG